jgi:RNA polymerase sigma-70 factor (ECF subfamily)
MHVASKTTTSLLEGLHDPAAQEVWAELDARFRPILRGFAFRMGLSEVDADDVTQETLTRFIKAYRLGKYDRERGRLSSWIIAIAQNCIHDLRQSRADRLERRGESAFPDVLESNQLESIWDEECRRVFLEHAMRELREETRTDPRTIRAFEMLAFEKREAADVATELGMSIDSVYVAKNRRLNRLREITGRLREIYEIS